MDLLWRDLQCVMEADDPTGRMAHEISRAMAAVGLVLPYAFQFEFAPITGKMHIHGVACLSSATQAELDQLWKILVKAGGKMLAASRPTPGSASALRRSCTCRSRSW